MNEKTRSSKKIWIIAVAALLVVAIAAGVIAVILNSKKEDVIAVLEYDGVEIPLSFYELMLSRTKASIAREMGTENLDSFFAAESNVKGKTNEQYYNELVLESCKYYLAALYIFEDEKIKLPQSYYDQINQDVQDCIDIEYIAGSEERLNEILSEYGVDIESYKDAFITHSKYEYLHTALYGDDGSKIGAAVKQSFADRHYHRFKQIIIPSYYYVYETDENGDNMYFDPSTGLPKFDTENGKYVMGDDNNYIRDSYGIKIAFDTEGNILYDKVNGVIKIADDTTYNYEGEALEAQREKAMEIASSISPKNFSAFEAKAEANVVSVLDMDANAVSDYYVSDIDQASYVGKYAYMNDLYLAIKDMGNGEVKMVETQYGFHVVMKYEIEDGAYEDSENEIWFENFNSVLVTEVFSNKCASILSDITVNEENLKGAKSIAEIGINYDYWK